MVDHIHRLNILLKQDRTHCRAEDYLSSSFQKNLLQANDFNSSFHQNLLQANAFNSIAAVVPSSIRSSPSSSSSEGINDLWRQKICEWYYHVVDFFGFSRQVVSIAMSFLDRYLSVRAVDKKHFQLAALTTLYMTIRIYERGALSMANMIDLGRRLFMMEHIISMEWSLLE
jgi:hypothetical protein